MIKILAINPGSTSTKVAVFEDMGMVFGGKLKHSAEDLAPYGTVYDQYAFRMQLILELLIAEGIDKNTLNVITGRGGNMKPVQGGTYQVNDRMIEDLKAGVMGQHASNLGGILAYEIANSIGVEAYVTDPVVVDELEEMARFSGIPDIQRKSKDHPLNQKAVARKAAAEMGGKYADFNFLVAHLGGGISVGAHRKGKIVDVNNCLDGDGPFSPERTGGLPVGPLIDLCYSGDYTKEQLRKKLIGSGGVVAYLGTNDGLEIEKRIDNGDPVATTVFQAMAYQIAKDIGAGAAVLCGDVDAILITGGLAFDKRLVSWITDRVRFIAPVKTFPGEHEMTALAEGVLRVLNHEEEAKIYT